MGWVNNLQIGKKLVLGFGILEALMIALGVFSVVQLSKVNANTVDIATNWLPSVRAIAQLKLDAADVRRDTLNFVIANSEKREHYREKINAELSALTDDEKKYERLISSEEERKLYQGWREQWDKYIAVNTRVMALAEQNRNTEAILLAQSEGSQFFEAAAKYSQDDVNLNDKGAADAAKQAAAVYAFSRYWVFGILTGAVVLGSVVALGLARSIASAAVRMLTMIQEVAAANLSIKDMQISSQDEIGQAGIALNLMKNSLHAMIGSISGYVDDISKGKVPAKITDAYNGDFNNIKNSLNACIEGLGGLVEANEVLQAMASNDYTGRVRGSYQGIFAEVGKATNKTADTLRGSMEMLGQNVQALSSAAEELTATSQQMSANAEETSTQTKVVSAATVSVSQNLQTVATGAEEMGASIKEIAKNATEAAKVATSAVKVAETANATVSKLGDSSAEIGQVIKVITSIAQQTNLLALNATIEAARAGEAGKGFAVVANEVKELAKETAKATEDISRKIEAIQTDTKAAVEAIGTISEVIHQINGISSTIASAVEEQNATTNEMSRNVSEAARGSGEITSNIAGVAQAAESTSRGAGDTQKAAQDLVETSTQLRRLVEQFKININENARGYGGAPATHRAAAHAGS
jgi:methyl-accepting chemotaxis protein